MTEFPSKTCGACEQKSDYARTAETHGDFLNVNTVPKPELVNKAGADLRDRHQQGEIGIPGAHLRPDLGVSPIKEKEIIKPQLGFADLPALPPRQHGDDPCCCARGDGKQPEIPCKADSPYKLRTFGNPTLEFPLHSMDQNPNTAYNQQVRQDAQPAIRADMAQDAAANRPLKGILKKRMPCPCADALLAHSPDGQQTQQKPPQIFGIADPITASGGKKKSDDEPEMNRACYLPKPEDAFPDNREDESGGLGAWATGRVDWGPLAGLTGVRPVVNKYSISRFSEGEWRARNKEVLDSIWDASHRANMLAFNSRSGIESACLASDGNQADSTRRLQQREAELHRYKCELERAISASDEEITNTLEARRRLKQSMAVLQMPESIAGESMDRRTGRLDPELVRDEVEEELIKEMALTSEIREQFTRALADIEHQLAEDKTAKARLENDWSDKQQTNETEAINVALNNRSTVLQFKPGAVGFPDNQSTQEHWEKFTRETLEESEQTRQRSVALRGTLASISTNAAKNLRAQADRVEMALQRRINCMEEMRTRLENELNINLKQIAEIETTMVDLRDTIRRLDLPLKCAQTRLDNRRTYRPRVENCRDAAHYGLVEEVKMINDDVSALSSQLKQAEAIQADLMMTRGKLEREIFIKKKTLEVDRDRIMKIRSYYPSASSLEGY